MALTDCIRKLGKAVSREDGTLLAEYLADGLTDEQAIQRLLIEADKDVIDITERARIQGAAVNKRSDVLGELRQIRGHSVDKLRAERKTIGKDIETANIEHGDIQFAIDSIRHWEPGGIDIDVNDDTALMARLSHIFFHPAFGPVIRTGEFAAGALTGKTPVELFNNFRAMELRQTEIRDMLGEFAAKNAALDDRMAMVIGERATDDTFFQDVNADLGFTSGLLTAARVAPIEKGTAQQWMSVLKKTAGVTPAEMEWLQMEEALNFLGSATKEEVVSYIENNGVEIEEVTLGGRGILFPKFDFEAASEFSYEGLASDTEFVDVYDVTEQTSGDLWVVTVDNDAGNVTVRQEGTSNYLVIDAEVNNQTVRDAELALERHYAANPIEGSFQGMPLNENATIDGGTNYREVILKLPQVGGTVTRLTGDIMSQSVETEITDDMIDALQGDVFGEVGLEQVKVYRTVDPNSQRRRVTYDGVSFEKDAVFQSVLARNGFKIESQTNYDHDMGKQVSPVGVQQNFDFSHFDYSNVLGWIRAKDRIGPNGEKILFIEEIQSDWHQRGRKLGYRKPVQDIQPFRISETELQYVAVDPDTGKPVKYQGSELSVGKGTVAGAKEAEEYILRLQRRAKKEAVSRQVDAVPDAPFKDNYWVQLVLKRAMRMAAEGGYDQISWTTGEQQVRRNNLRRHVSEITWNPVNNELVAYKGANKLVDTVVPAQKLPDYIGAGPTTEMLRAVRQRREEAGYTKINIVDLVVGDNVTRSGITLLEQFGMTDGYVVVDDTFSVVTDKTGRPLMKRTADALETEIMGDLFSTQEPAILQGEDLEAGGGGMKNFYDNTLPRVLQKAARKLDKKSKTRLGGTKINTMDGEPFTLALEEVHTGIDEATGAVNPPKPMYFVKNRFGQSVSGPFRQRVPAEEILNAKNSATTDVHSMDISPQIRQNAMNGQTLFQKKKGSITFNEARQGMIKLFESADFSTFIHEAGHLYLETMGGLAGRIDSPQQIRDDYAKILEYLGVANRSEITREHHELWARSFEKYTMDGKAPSLAMQDAFNAFKAWLTQIYKRVRGVAEINLTEDIRGVMDRILASEAEIAQAEQAQEYTALFQNPEQMGVTPEVFKVYRGSITRAHNESVEKETARMMDAVNREQKAWWKDERKTMEAEVSAEAYENNTFVALAMLQKGKQPDGSPTRMAPFKLNRDDLLSRYGKDFIKQLPKPWVYSAKGGVDADVAAQVLGYESGDAMVKDLIQSPSMEAWIQATTDTRMKEKFPDPLTDGTLHEDAMRLVHSDRRGQILAAEMRALRARMSEDRAIVTATRRDEGRQRREARDAQKGTLPKRAEVAMIKAAARQSVTEKRIRDLKPHVYLNAERKASRLAFEFSTTGNWFEAYQQKRRQLVNHEMYRAATKAKDEAATQQKYLNKFGSKRVQQRLGRSGVLNQILAVLEGVDFRTTSLAEVDRQEAVNEMIQAVEDGRLVVPQDLMAKLRRTGTNWQNLTVSEFRAMRDLVKQLEHAARREVEALVNGEKIIIEEAAGQVAESIHSANKVIDMGVGEKKRGERFKKSAEQGIAVWLRPSSIARVLDGAGFGAVTRNVIVPIRRAYAERLIPMLHKSEKDVAQIYRNHYDKVELQTLHSKRIHIDTMGESFSKADILSLAMNWGSESSRSAVLGGVKRDGSQAFPEAGVRQMLAHMTAKDWAFVQETWDYIDSYWGDLSAAEQRRRGIAPQKVEASPFTIRTSDGQEINVRGGYYPLAYAAEHSDRHKSDKIEDIYKKMGNGVYVTANTRAGATYDRVQNHGLVVRLGLNRTQTHLREIIRDIAVGDEVTFVKKLLNNRDVRNAFEQTGNGVMLDTLNLWLTDAAVGELPAEGFAEQGAAWIRTGFTKSKLAWNVLTTILQFTGAFQSMATIGSVHYSKGLARYMVNPKAATRDALERSKFLNTRYVVGTWDKDVQDTKSHLDSFFGPAPTAMKTTMNALSYTYFWPIMKAQQVVDVSTWMAAEQKGRNELQLNDADAILYADSQVEAAQTSGFFSDRSGLERGTLGPRKNRQAQFIRIWTTLISYMLAKGNIAYEKGRATNYRKPSQVAALAGDLILLFTVEGIASAIIYDQWPEGDDDPEDWGWWALEKSVESVVSGIPFVREIPATKFGGGNTPLGAFAHDLWTLGVQIGQGESDDAARKAFVNAAGTAFHLPASQTNRVLDQIWSEDDPEVYEYIFGERSE